MVRTTRKWPAGAAGDPCGVIGQITEQTEGKMAGDKNRKLDPHPGSNTEKPPEQWVSGDER